MRFLPTLLSVAALYISPVYPAIAKHTPANAQGINYSVSIPASTTSAGSGPIYFQITAPSTFRWVALGIGSQMAGATIFVTYSSASGSNVTISPRSGVGEFQPLFNSAAQVTVLEGSGIANGVMTANIRYIAGNGLLNGASTQSNWIASWQKGSALNTDSPSAAITQHDDHDQFTFDLTKAVDTSDINPFIAAVAPGVSGSASPTASAWATNSAPGGAVATSGSDSGSSSVSIGSSATVTDTFRKAHGVIMSSVVVILLPIGAMVMRLFGGPWVHAFIQIISLFALIAGFGIGIRLAQMTDYLFNTPHTLLGTTVVCLFVVQPFIGLLHHRQYSQIKRRSYFGHLHIWYGRILIVLGVINGGLGLQLAANSPSGEIAYGVVAGVMAVLYVAVMLFTGMRKRRAEKIG